MQLLRLRWNVSREVDAVSQGGRKTRLVQGAREEGVEEYTMSFSFLSCPFLLFVRPSDQRGSPCQDPAGNRTTRRPDHYKEAQLQWYGHVSRSSGLAKTILQGTVKGGRRQGRQKKSWEDNIREWTGLEFAKSQRAVENRENGENWL